jgi:hypothetical protein
VPWLTKRWIEAQKGDWEFGAPDEGLAGCVMDSSRESIMTNGFAAAIQYSGIKGGPRAQREAGEPSFFSTLSPVCSLQVILPFFFGLRSLRASAIRRQAGVLL